MDTIRLLYSYGLFFVSGAVVGAIFHKKILIWIRKFKAWCLMDD